MVPANLGNAIVLLAATGSGPTGRVAWIWFAALVLYLVPLAYKLRARRGRPAPTSVSPRTLRRLTVETGVLGLIWGAAPLLLIGGARGEELIVVSVCIGMLCGGAFVMATIPAAVLAYVLTMAGGLFWSVAFQARDHIHLLAAPLIFCYAAILIGGALSHARSFAERVIAQARAELAARHDPLTGLPNRAAFNASIEEAFDRLHRYGERFALLSIDLDDFKGVNDRWGHQAGDQLLRQAADRLSDALDSRGFIARLGGDEFAIIARGLFEPGAAARLAADIGFKFDAPFALDIGLAQCRASVGYAIAPADGASSRDLLGAADAALYRSKREVRSAPPVLPRPDAGQARNRRELAQDLRSALTRNEFFLQYQPIQSLRSGRTEGFEALVRWRHPRLGLIPPGDFIDIAEKSGSIHELGEWILHEACREANSWPEAIRIAVNVSAEQLCDASIDRVVESALRASGLSANRLQIEVTESAALAAIEQAALALRRMHERGAAIVLDDFGTGYSSFDHIRRLPVSRVKIDRSFVSDLPEGRESGAIVHAVVCLARALDLDITAEGVETEAQRMFLELAGCTSGQGYLFARPLDAVDARARLAGQQPRKLSVA